MQVIISEDGRVLTPPNPKPDVARFLLANLPGSALVDVTPDMTSAIRNRIAQQLIHLEQALVYAQHPDDIEGIQAEIDRLCSL